MLNGPNARTFYVMPDNGFGAKTNSADALLRIYAVRPNFRGWDGGHVVGAGTVTPAEFHSGRPLKEFNDRAFINLHDSDHRLGFEIVAGMVNYPNGAGNIPVDPTIKSGRLLTGADLDIESVRKDRRGHLWFGEEFGPFLVEADRHGKVLRAEVRTPNIAPPGSTATGAEVRSPQNPTLPALSPTPIRVT